MNLKPHQKSSVPAEKDLTKKWYLVDVKGKTLGRISTKIADLLRGKGKPIFTPKADCGDYVVVIHAADVKLAGNKMDTKLYQWHTRYPGGFRERTAREIMKTKPEKIVMDAVWGMLPRNRLRRQIIKKLRVFPGAEHGHASQHPESITL